MAGKSVQMAAPTSTTTERKLFFQKFVGRFASYVKEFTEISTLHGVKYISMSNLHSCEISFWLVVILASVFGACKLIAQSYQHYNENPTVITIEKNYKEWRVTFPAATFCFLDNLDANRAKAFIEETWQVRPDLGDEELEESEDANDMNSLFPLNETDSAKNESHGQQDFANAGTYRYYFTFLQNLVNQTFTSMETFEKYINDNTVSHLNVTNAVLKVIKQHEMKSNFYTKDFNDTEFHLTPTEMGMCYVHGGKLADYITLGDVPKVRENFQPPTCTYGESLSLCYARTEGFPSDIRYYIHSPYELPDSAHPYFVVNGRMDRDSMFNCLETTVSEGIDRLSPSQRHCRFMHEPTVPHLRVYSFNLCRMQCRKELSFKLCGCAPYFYTKEGRIPVCGVKGLACLSRFSEQLITLRTSKVKLPCTCLPQCKDIRYTIDKEIIRSWMFPIPYDIRFRWAINKFSKIRLRRDVIYSFTDLVVSFGGTATFFLGCSVLTFVEIVYFFTLRLFWFVIGNVKADRRLQTDRIDDRSTFRYLR